MWGTDMAESLLAHLYTRIKGSQEDVATLSLQYILSQSAELNRAFTKQVADCLHIELGELQYICQATGENNERPDMAGVDTFGNEHVLCEMKFYAGLTENQPLGYIDRLRDKNGKGLIFICPKVRKTLLWKRLCEICAAPGNEVRPQGEYCIQINGINLSIVTWSQVLDRLTEVSSALSLNCSSDIKQLVGFCNQMDSDAFIPFVTEDLTADVAKKIDRYYQVVDETTKLLHADKALKTSSKGLKVSNSRDYYSTRMLLDEFGVEITYNRNLWKNPSSRETPFWLGLWDEISEANVWTDSPEFLKKCMSFPDGKNQDGWLALEAPTNATLDEVCQNLKEQILQYVNALR